MSTKTDTALGNYIETGSKKINGKTAAVKYAEQLSTSKLLWLLVKRHKLFLMAIGNIILVLNWVMPEWTELVKSLI